MIICDRDKEKKKFQNLNVPMKSFFVHKTHISAAKDHFRFLSFNTK